MNAIHAVISRSVIEVGKLNDIKQGICPPLDKRNEKKRNTTAILRSVTDKMKIKGGHFLSFSSKKELRNPATHTNVISPIIKLQYITVGACLSFKSIIPAVRRKKKHTASTTPRPPNRDNP